MGAKPLPATTQPTAPLPKEGVNNKILCAGLKRLQHYPNFKRLLISKGYLSVRRAPNGTYLCQPFKTANLQLLGGSRFTNYSKMTAAEKSDLICPGLEVLSDGTLVITPSATSSARDFDFLEGRQHVYHRKLKERLAGSNDWFEFDGDYEIRQVIGGIGNMEKYELFTNDGTPLEGMNLRLFNPATKLWSIYWADSISGTLEAPLVGSFENGVGHFYTVDMHNGQPIIIQFRYDSTEKDNPNWRQAFSADGGQTWEWNWYMKYK